MDKNTEETLSAICDDARLPVMAEVLEVLVDRGSVDEPTLRRLGPDGVLFLYQTYVGPAVDKIEEFFEDGGAG
jgi:hypothetical protein